LLLHYWPGLFDCCREDEIIVVVRQAQPDVRHVEQGIACLVIMERYRHLQTLFRAAPILVCPIRHEIAPFYTGYKRRQQITVSGEQGMS
jgi:hypothetical protein